MKLLHNALAVAALALLTSTAFAQTPKTYIYTEGNVGNPLLQNNVYAYSADGSGTLTAVPGSPFLTGGSGVFATSGDEFNADQEVIANQAGSVLYAVNGHSNDISAFTINADGSLTTVAGSPYPSGGQDPVSLGTAGRFLVVANKNEDPRQLPNDFLPNYTSCTVNADGSLVLNPGSTIDLAVGSSPSQTLIWPKGHVVFGLEFQTSRIATFSFDQAGFMTELSAVTPPTENNLFLGEVLHPAKKILYAGLLKTNEVAVYRYDRLGNLTFVTSVPNSGTDICWFKVNAAGTRLYSSESVTDTLTVYDISQPLAPVELQHYFLSSTNGPVTNLAIDPAGGYLYALVGTAIHVVALDANGLMSEPGSPVQLPGLNHQRALGLVVVRK
jgi:6-phosphogluconolactonase (cycloisomerase 2 family)